MIFNFLQGFMNTIKVFNFYKENNGFHEYYKSIEFEYLSHNQGEPLIINLDN